MKLAPIIFFLLLLASIVYGFGTSDPGMFGHSGGEIQVVYLDTLTSLQDVTETVEKINNQTTKEWKLLVEGSEWTEKARTTITENDIVAETSTTNNNQYVQASMGSWPATNPQELRFVVVNGGDDFCLGGGGVLDLSGTVTNARCTMYQYDKDVPVQLPQQNNDWIQLRVNGVVLEHCVDDLPRQPLEGNLGMYMYSYLKGYCLYAQADWNGVITQLEVESSDRSASYGRWNWEIWYR